MYSKKEFQICKSIQKYLFVILILFLLHMYYETDYILWLPEDSRCNRSLNQMVSFYPYNLYFQVI